MRARKLRSSVNTHRVFLARTMMRLIAALSSTTVLGACVSVPSLNAPTTPDPNAIQKRVATLVTLSSENIQGANRVMSPSEYARTGYNEVREACDKFFTTLIQKTNSTQLSKADWTALGTAAGTIIALAHAGASKPVGIAAAAFGLGASAYDNYQKYALLTLYPEQTKTLVFKTLDAYEASSPASAAADIVDADSRVSAFAAICTYSNINVLAQNAIATTTPTVAPAAPSTVFTTQAELDKVAEIEQVLGVASISDADLATLELMAKKQAGETDVVASLSSMADSLSAPVKKAVWDGAAVINTKFTSTVTADLTALMGNQQFAKLVNDSIAKSKAATPTATPPGTLGVGQPSPSPVFIPPSGAPQAWRPPTILLNANGNRPQ